MRLPGAADSSGPSDSGRIRAADARGAVFLFWLRGAGLPGAWRGWVASGARAGSHASARIGGASGTHRARGSPAVPPRLRPQRRDHPLSARLVASAARAALLPIAVPKWEHPPPSGAPDGMPWPRPPIASRSRYLGWVGKMPVTQAIRGNGVNADEA